jgi:hypothetical protein
MGRGRPPAPGGGGGGGGGRGAGLGLVSPLTSPTVSDASARSLDDRLGVFGNNGGWDLDIHRIQVRQWRG